jgi:hypothetical protein
VAGVADLGIHAEDDEPHQAPAVGPGVGPQVPAPVVMDPGVCLSMVNVKPPQLQDLEIESMKKFILEFKRYSQKCPEPLRRKMQQFILEEHLEFVISENEMIDHDECVDLERDGTTSSRSCSRCTKRIQVVSGGL